MLSKSKLLCCLSLLLNIWLVAVAAGRLERVDDTDMVHLLTSGDNVIALFTKDNCRECDDLETVVENIEKELKESLNAVVVKAHNSQMVGIYDPSREPSLIFFRKGIPLLYHGEANEEEIMSMFGDSREPVVKELSDENFEHLTQAATGATTGDWFVFFYSADCILCQRLYAVWESVGAKLRRRLNVARVNRLEAGISTAKRFGIAESPEFIYLRQGKVYRYKSKEYTPKKFIAFVESEYRKQTKPEAVPPEANVLNDALTGYINSLLENPKFMTYASITVLIILLLAAIKSFLSKKPKPASKKPAAKPSKKAK